MSRLAVYTIAKNEAATAERFMAACRDADTVIVGDTGSTDNTVEILRDLGATVIPIRVSPWRFDIARNTVLSLVPEVFDLCFALDLDEYPQPGWRDHIEPVWDGMLHSRMWFRYIHSFTETGAPANVGKKGFAHNRSGYIWKHRVHEDIYWQGNPAAEQHLHIPELVVEHHQLPQQHRELYTELLKEECASETVTPRHVFWLCREFFRQQSWGSLLASCAAFLNYKDVWHVEKAHCLIMQAAAFRNTVKQHDAIKAYLQACDASPQDREPWFEFGRMFYGNKQWAQAYGMFSECLEIKQRADHYLTSDSAWDYWPHYMAAVCMHKLGSPQAAAVHARAAADYTTTPRHLQALLQELQPYLQKV